MKRLVFACVAGVSMSAQAFAWSDLDRMQVASALGTVLAAEEVCGLSFDQEAVRGFIDEKVPADDMQFPGMLQTMTMGAGHQLDETNGAARAAHCRQVERVARSYGFTE